MDYEYDVNYKTVATALAVLLVVAVSTVIYALSVNSNLKAEIVAKDDIMKNLFEQNATMAELVCTYAKIVGGTQPEICLEG